MTHTLDFEEALHSCRSALTRSRFEEAIRCYNSGAYRSSVTAVWTAVLYDLHAKLDELASADDGAAKVMLEEWNNALVAKNIAALLDLERTLLDRVSTELEILDETEKDLLERIREDRNLCAHPAILSDGSHFTPSPELVRSHLSHAAQFLFMQKPTQGKSIIKTFTADVQSPGFPEEDDPGINYVHDRFLTHTRHTGVRNIGIMCAKVLVSGKPDEIWPERKKLLVTLRAINGRHADAWREVEAKIVSLVDQGEPDVGSRCRAVMLCSQLPTLWNKLDRATRTAITTTIEEADWQGAETETDLQTAASIPDLATAVNKRHENFEEDQIRECLEHFVVPEFWPKALETFAGSGSFRTAEANFASLITPFRNQIDEDQLIDLMTKVNANSQIWNAARIPSQLRNFFTGITSIEQLPTALVQKVYEAINEDRRADFEDLWTALEQNTAWTRPDDPEDANAAAEVDDDIPF